MNAMIAATVYCIVGCNTGSPDKDALKVLECDTETGAAKIVQSVNGCEGTTYYQISKDGKTLYSVFAEKVDNKSHGALVKFALDGHRIGEMTRLAGLSCETPCHVALSPDESIMSVAVYWSGIYGVMALDERCATLGRDACPQASADGTYPPSEASRVSGGYRGECRPYLTTAALPNDAVGPRKDRQQKAFAHQTFYTPDGKLMGVCDLGCDRVNFYDYKKPGGLEKPVITLKADPGDGPRHALFSNDGKFLFVVNELSSTVTSYKVAKGTPNLVGASFQDARGRVGDASLPFTRIGKWSMLPEGCTLKETETKAAAIKLTGDGKILMASNRGHDSIAFYAVNDDGTLTMKNVAKLTGKFPRDFELMPGEKFMVVGHKMSNEIQVYAFDREKCELKAVGEPIPCWRPLCFKFLK
ncbi:MAG: lactonase family protein [Kiritimatiellae bacterium]|nr:lactonase family protein [Kiritimatiellia bacterium]